MSQGGLADLKTPGGLAKVQGFGHGYEVANLANRGSRKFQSRAPARAWETGAPDHLIDIEYQNILQHDIALSHVISTLRRQEGTRSLAWAPPAGIGPSLGMQEG